jgi:hypothetical protein
MMKPLAPSRKIYLVFLPVLAGLLLVGLLLFSAGDGQARGGNEVQAMQAPAFGETGDGAPAGGSANRAALDDSGPDVAEALDQTFSYFRLVGTAFNPRTSTTTFAYGFNGCVYITGGSDNRFMAPLFLPDGAEIKYLRFYYDDTNAGSNLTAWITRYQPGVTSEDLTTVNSTAASGYGTSLSPEITHTVDLTSWAYTLIVAPNGNGTANQFCGVRVAYYAPTIFPAFLPTITK